MDRKKTYKISDDPLSKRCGYAGCRRWLKHKKICAPCSKYREVERLAIGRWNMDVVGAK